MGVEISEHRLEVMRASAAVWESPHGGAVRPMRGLIHRLEAVDDAGTLRGAPVDFSAVGVEPRFCCFSFGQAPMRFFGGNGV